MKNEEIVDDEPKGNNIKSILFGILAILAIVLIGRFVGGYFGRSQAELELRQRSGLETPIPEKKPEAQSDSDTESFVRRTFPHGISVDIPVSWIEIKGQENEEIENFATRFVGKSGPRESKKTSVNLFRANSTPKTTYAGVSINVSESKLDPDEFRRVNLLEISSAATYDEMKADFEKLFASSPQKLLDVGRPRREFVGPHPTLVLSYTRSGPEGPVVVIMYWIFLEEKRISLNLSYRESETSMWASVVSHIRNSLVIS